MIALSRFSKGIWIYVVLPAIFVSVTFFFNLVSTVDLDRKSPVRRVGTESPAVGFTELAQMPHFVAEVSLKQPFNVDGVPAEFTNGFAVTLRTRTNVIFLLAKHPTRVEREFFDALSEDESYDFPEAWLEFHRTNKSNLISTDL